MRLVLFLFLLTPALAREWTREGGTAMKLQAELRGIDGANVMLQAPDGRTAAFPLAQFSAADRQFVTARLSGMVLDAMPALNVGQKAGAGWGRPLSADPADCTITETSGGFQSKHFDFKTAEKMPAATMRDLAEACEVVHELFRVAPWGVLSVPKRGGRFEIALLPQSEIETNQNVFDAEGVLRIPFGAAGLEKIAGEWLRDESPGAGRNLKEFVSYMLMRDVVGLVPPWLPDALADCIAEIPTVGGTAWCAEVPVKLQSVAKVTPPQVEALFQPGERDSYSKEHALAVTHYFTRLADGRRAQQISSMLRQAMADRPKWDAFDVALKKYQEEWEVFKKTPGVVKTEDGRYQYPSSVTPPSEAPKPPQEYQNGDDLPWLLLPLLLEKKSPRAAAEAISDQIAKP
ncbi:MAG: hypothetical protein IPK32_15210 [Verrucomicrobiaceae bacterium]|nr:hypothetical protein [Verrucomicrobiaceae bacterium]